jgi:hypothetical protein
VLGRTAMQRSKTIALGVLVLVLIAIAVLVSRSSKPRASSAAPSASAKPSASVVVAAPPPSASAADLAFGEPYDGESVGFDLLPDGKKAPPLPENAPQSVSFGVVVFSYAGAEFATPGARTKDQAREKALAVVADAKSDFSKAVARGDRGSTASAGRVPRGVLEPAAEYVLFTLPKGEVAPAPVDTPRGYWVVRRND